MASKVTKVNKVDQGVYDQIMLLFLETVSSSSYLNANGIYRPDTVNWLGFVKSINKQGTAESGYKPGIYPRSVGHGSVHYYGVRREKNGRLKVGNGYKTIGGLSKNYGVGLDAQRDHSHGLCQTFALMFYFGKEKLLKPGKYFENMKIGLKYLDGFLNVGNRNWEWPNSVNVLRNMTRLSNFNPGDTLTVLKKIGGKNGIVTLKKIIGFLRSHEENLKAWSQECGLRSGSRSFRSTSVSSMRITPMTASRIRAPITVGSRRISTRA